MFLYPALTIGFLFVGVPLLVHLINMLRHRRQRWAAMDFLLASYRKQKKWIILRQLLLLLSRIAVAALLIALLCGWTGGRRLLGAFGGRTSHHVVILDDSYSMGDRSGGGTAYERSLVALQDLTRRLASDDGNHQLTVLRASRAALAVRGGSEAGDVAADLSAQTVASDARLINRVMSTEVSPLRTTLVSSIDMASELLASTPADERFLYIASDFRKRDWESAQRLAESLRAADAAGAEIRMIDCASKPTGNLAITDLSPAPDVWVAGVPVVIRVTVRNFGATAVSNVPLSSRVIRYGQAVNTADPSRRISGEMEPQPAIIIESLEPGASITKKFQVYVAESGTHAVEVALPDDALAIDNRRSCTLPLSETEKVLIIDDDPDGRGAYHVTSVLDPGSQVRVGAVPDVQPASFLRSITLDALATYRAVYLIDVPEINDSAAAVIAEYVRRGGGLCWFLGQRINPQRYNETLWGGERQLLPRPLAESVSLEESNDTSTGDVIFAEQSELLEPLRPLGDAAFNLVGLNRSWSFGSPVSEENGSGGTEEAGAENDSQEDADAERRIPRMREALRRRDGLPLVTVHDVGRGRVITVLTGLDGSWTNWPGDPTFVVFLLQSNAALWSGAAPPTQRLVSDPIVKVVPADRYLGTVMFLPATSEPPRVPIELSPNDFSAPGNSSDQEPNRITLDPSEQVIADGANIGEILRPGIGEWQLTRTDGSVEVVPIASVIQPAESELERANAAEIRRELQPLEIEYLSSAAWSDENRGAGNSTLMLVLLGLLVGLLGVEQSLAYWASYHVAVAGSRGGSG